MGDYTSKSVVDRNPKWVVEHTVLLRCCTEAVLPVAAHIHYHQRKPACLSLVQPVSSLTAATVTLQPVLDDRRAAVLACAVSKVPRICQQGV